MTSKPVSRLSFLQSQKRIPSDVNDCPMLLQISDYPAGRNRWISISTVPDSPRSSKQTLNVKVGLTPGGLGCVTCNGCDGEIKSMGNMTVNLESDDQPICEPFVFYSRSSGFPGLAPPFAVIRPGPMFFGYSFLINAGMKTGAHGENSESMPISILPWKSNYA